MTRRLELMQQHLEAEDRAGALEHAYALEQMLERHGAARREDPSLQDTYESIRETISQLEDAERGDAVDLPAAAPPAPPPSPARRMALRVAGGIALLAAVLVGWPVLRADRENALLQDHMSHVMLLSEVRGIDVAVSARHGREGRVLVYSVNAVDSTVSEDAMLALLLRFAGEVRGERFAAVDLASRGVTRYRLPGTYFASLGEEAAQANPIYTEWTFPANVRNPDGSRAFPARTGPWQETSQAEVADFHQLCRAWYGASGR